MGSTDDKGPLHSRTPSYFGVVIAVLFSWLQRNACHFVQFSQVGWVWFLALSLRDWKVLQDESVMAPWAAVTEPFLLAPPSPQAQLTFCFS